MYSCTQLRVHKSMGYRLKARMIHLWSAMIILPCPILTPQFKIVVTPCSIGVLIVFMYVVQEKFSQKFHILQKISTIYQNMVHLHNYIMLPYRCCTSSRLISNIIKVTQIQTVSYKYKLHHKS